MLMISFFGHSEQCESGREYLLYQRIKDCLPVSLSCKPGTFKKDAFLFAGLTMQTDYQIIGIQSGKCVTVEKTSMSDPKYPNLSSKITTRCAFTSKQRSSIVKFLNFIKDKKFTFNSRTTGTAQVTIDFNEKGVKHDAVDNIGVLYTVTIDGKEIPDPLNTAKSDESTCVTEFKDK